MAFILISGPNGSGKSLFAENLVAQTQGKRFYIATMKAQTEDNRKRIEKHRKQREALNFETLELPFTVSSAEVDGSSIVLLEDVSNLLANCFFEKSGSVSSVLEDIVQLKDRCKILIAVTIDGLNAEDYCDETAEYISALNTLNKELYELADQAFGMENQQPVCLKGEFYAHS